jgi:hypothetical protein
MMGVALFISNFFSCGRSGIPAVQARDSSRGKGHHFAGGVMKMDPLTSTRRRRGAVGLVGIGLAAAGMIAIVAGAQHQSKAPPDLRQTGLYADFGSKTVRSGILSYSPQYPLWSDGAKKRRWIYLPPGTSIDAADPDVWDFPAGTRIWKEFSFGGRRVETRLIEALGGGEWRFASYVWNAQETDAVLAPEEGLREVAEIQPGLRHDIPGVLDCQACHVNKRTEVLGFSALQLSLDRDPNSPHAEPVIPDMVNLTNLIERGLIRSYPSGWKGRPLRISASTPRGRAALGYLHANCGNCHNPGGSLDTLNLLMRHSVAENSPGEPALEAAVNHKGRFRIPGVEAGSTFFIRPGDAEHSSVLYRMSSRNPFRQMPPLGTKLADLEAVQLIRLWIEEDLAEKGAKPGGE